MKAYIERLLDEKAELEKRVIKLNYFLNELRDPNKIFPDNQKKLLEKQLRIMREYLLILGKRINLI